MSRSKLIRSLGTGRWRPTPPHLGGGIWSVRRMAKRIEQPAFLEAESGGNEHLRAAFVVDLSCGLFVLCGWRTLNALCCEGVAFIGLVFGFRWKV